MNLTDGASLTDINGIGLVKSTPSVSPKVNDVEDAMVGYILVGGSVEVAGYDVNILEFAPAICTCVT